MFALRQRYGIRKILQKLWLCSSAKSKRHWSKECVPSSVMRGMLHPDTESRRFMATVLPMVEKPAGMKAGTQTPPIEHRLLSKNKDWHGLFFWFSSTHKKNTNRNQFWHRNDMKMREYSRQLRSLLLYLCYGFRALINSFVYWFWHEDSLKKPNTHTKSEPYTCQKGCAICILTEQRFTINIRKKGKWSIFLFSLFPSALPEGAVILCVVWS